MNRVSAGLHGLTATPQRRFVGIGLLAAAVLVVVVVALIRAHGQPASHRFNGDGFSVVLSDGWTEAPTGAVAPCPQYRAAGVFQSAGSGVVSMTVSASASRRGCLFRVNVAVSTSSLGGSATTEQSWSGPSPASPAGHYILATHNGQSYFVDIEGTTAALQDHGSEIDQILRSWQWGASASPS